jgi:hypothetical protein
MAVDCSILGQTLIHKARIVAHSMRIQLVPTGLPTFITRPSETIV